ncbi:MAG: hypothetical protein Tsb005_00180 [Gammaproteobacteria bacterium]
MSRLKIFLIVMIALAVLMGILAIALPISLMQGVIYVTRFFEVMIPVLAVGALIKYLLSDLT